MRKNEPNASKHCVIVRISALFPYSTCPVTVNMRNSFVVCAPLSVKPVQHIAKCSKTLTARSVQECAENVQRSAVIWRVKTKQGERHPPVLLCSPFRLYLFFLTVTVYPIRTNTSNCQCDQIEKFVHGNNPICILTISLYRSYYRISNLPVGMKPWE
jgi:hypothetical protein